MKLHTPEPTAGGDAKRDHFSTSHLLSDLKLQSARGGAVTLIAQFLRAAIALGATAVLARLLTPGDFGLVAMVQAITGFLAMFGDAGLSAATVQRQEVNQRQISTLFWLNMILGLGLMGVIAALAPVIVWFYGDPRLFGVTLAMSLSFPITALSIQHQALLRRQLRFSRLAGVSVMSEILGVAAAIGAALWGATYWSLVFGTLVTVAVRAVATWLASGWVPGRMRWTKGVGSMVRFGGELTAFEALSYASANLDRVLLGRFWGDRILGLYSRAYRLLMMPIKHINTPVAAVAIPALSRLQGDANRYRLGYLQMLEKLVMITIPLAILMIASADWIIALILGPQWTEAAEIFVYLGFAAILLPVGHTSGWLFVSQGRSRDMLQWGALNAVIKIVSIAVGLPWGARGVAIAVMVRTYLAFPLLWWVTCRTGPVRQRDIYRCLGPVLVAATAALAAALSFRRVAGSLHPAIGIFSLSAISLTVNLLVLAALPAGRRSLRDFWSLASSLLRRWSA